MEALPKTGLVVFKGETPICAGFLYRTDSSICWLEWIISAPHTAKTERGQALDRLIQGLTEIAKNEGFGVIFTSSNHEGLKARLAQFEFQETDKGVSQFIRRLS